MKEQTNKKSIPILIGIIGVLMMLLAGTIGYILGGTNLPKSSLAESANNQKVLKEIEALKSMYDAKIADKTTTYNALQLEKEKVNQLVAELEKTKGDANALLKYKTEYKNLESKMQVLVTEILTLKGNKKKAINTKSKPLQTTNDYKENNGFSIPKTANQSSIKSPKRATSKFGLGKETTSVKGNDVFSKAATAKNEVVEDKNNSEASVQKPVEKKISKVTMTNVKAGAFEFKSVGNYIETNKSNKVDVLKISFTLEANSGAQAGEKLYYFQIINGKNNVLGKRITEFFEDQSLTYSFKKSFDYSSETTNFTQEFLQDDFVAGTYYINIFDRGELVGRSTFVLK